MEKTEVAAAFWGVAATNPQAEVPAFAFTAEDIRFTTRGDALYAIALGWRKTEGS